MRTRDHSGMLTERLNEIVELARQSGRVTVEDLAPYRLPRDENAPATTEALKPRLPAAYRDPGNTPIRREVKPGQQTIDLELSWTEPVNQS